MTAESHKGFSGRHSKVLADFQMSLGMNVNVKGCFFLFFSCALWLAVIHPKVAHNPNEVHGDGKWTPGQSTFLY